MWAASPASSTRPLRYAAACRVALPKRDSQTGVTHAEVGAGDPAYGRPELVEGELPGPIGPVGARVAADQPVDTAGQRHDHLAAVEAGDAGDAGETAWGRGVEHDVAEPAPGGGVGAREVDAGGRAHGAAHAVAADHVAGLDHAAVGLTQEEQALPARFTTDLDVGPRPALQRVAPTLLEGSFEERFAFGVAELLHQAWIRTGMAELC